MLYEIFEGNMPRLQKKLATIKNKCNLYGCEFSYQEVGETFKQVKDEETGLVHTTKFITVDVSGTAKVSDWEFVATIEHSNPCNIIRSFRPEIQVPDRFYTVENRCEHCNKKRNRKDTYLVHNTVTNEFKQVGKSCLKDFTKGLSSEAVTAYISWFDELIKGEHPTPGFTPYYPTDRVLQYAVEAVSLYGYSKVYVGSIGTQGIVREQMFERGDWRRRLEDGFDVDREGNAERVHEILNWVRSLPTVFGYLSNLRAACLKEYCEIRDFGLVCSVVVAYNREMERKAHQKAVQKASEISNWVGSEGDRIELHDLSVKVLTSWETQFGDTRLYKLTDSFGNIFIWKTGTWISNDKVSLRGTIKGHKEYNGIRQTELTRCRII